MWDAALVARVRDRKLNEILIFASLAKIDSARIDDYIDIIVSLGDDIDACDTLLETDGEAEISLDVIDREEYLERLSPGEAADEEAFNSLKVEPGPREAEDREYFRRIISEAVDSIITERSSVPADDFEDLRSEHDAALALIEELKSTIGELEASNSVMSGISDELNGTRAELAQAKSDMEVLRQANVALTRDVEQLRVEAELAATLRSQLETSTATEESLRGKVDELASTVGSLVSERDAALAERDALASLESENEALRDRVSQLEASDLREAMTSLKDELAMVRRRNEELSAELDYAKESVATAEAARIEAEARADQLMERIGCLSAELEESRERNRRMIEVVDQGIQYACLECDADPEPEISEPEPVPPEDEVPAPEPEMCDPEPPAPEPDQSDIEADEAESAAPEPAPSPAGERAVVDMILTDEELETLRMVREMKGRKEDEFIDRSLQGRLDENVCDDVVTFLKVDVGICDALLSMDYTDFDSIVAGFRRILEILEEAPEPRYQNRYLRSLSAEDRALEDRYVAIVNRAHDVLATRYLRFLGKGSA